MVPAVLELGDYEENGGQGKGLPSLCSGIAAGQPCFKSFALPLAWG